jgi:hypothetical protein
VVTGQGKRAAISIFDGAASLTAANGTIEGWLAERDSGFGRLVVQVATGEVVAQRGL